MRFSVVFLFIWKNYKNVPLLLEKKNILKLILLVFFSFGFLFCVLKNLRKGKTIEISECAKLNLRRRRRKKMLKIQMIRGISQL